MPLYGQNYITRAPRQRQEGCYFWGLEEPTELAEDRTDWAEDRTFASWIGGGMGAIGLALAFKAIFGAFEPTYVAKFVSTIPLCATVILFWSVERKVTRALHRLNEHKITATGHRTLKFIAALMSLTTLGTAYILWAL